MATNSFSTTLTLTIIIIIFSSSHQPLALNHTPRFFGKFASSTSTIPSNSKRQFDYHYQTKFFQQQLDHFSFSNLPTFPQRYLINTQNWTVGSGPIFLYCGNEGDIVWFAQNTGFVWEIAPKFGAMVVFPEVSKEEAYKNATTLAFLNAEQALADFAVLVTDLKRNLSAIDCPVVLFGGSYGGMLAAWMRLKKLKSTEELSGWLESAYSYLAMVNYPYPSEFMMPLPGHPIKEVCRRIDGGPAGTSILERIYEGANVYYNYTGEAKCFELDDDPHGLDGWNWQACTEMVMPMSCSKESSMFPPYEYNYSSFEEDCLKNFGVKPRPKWITTEFGGHNIHATLKNFGSNIIFSNGLLDPWSGGSVLQNISESIVSLVTEEGAHHIDLRASTENDPD
ncbi:hypothetical protein TSUD_183410, partial [Trifolium subterraneum]